MRLFEAFSVPSVRAQTETVRWLVYIDPNSPRWLLERLGPFVDAQLFVLHARQEVTEVELLSDIRALLPEPTTRVITTNLDNDDALALDFSSRVRAAAARPGTAAIYVDYGVVLAGDLLYLRRDPANAFCSVVADVDLDVTCWRDWHNRLHLHMPVRHVAGRPGWLQTVHGGNVSNRVRGRLVSPSTVAAHFPGLLVAVPEPRLGTVAREAWVRRPLRLLRDAARGSTRSVGVRLLGKEGFTHLKGVVARRTRQVRFFLRSAKSMKRRGRTRPLG
jgi:hypothetical protein